MNATRSFDRRTFVRGGLSVGGMLLGGFLLEGCSQASDQPAAQTSAGAATPAVTTAAEIGRPLVVYFTCPEPTGTDTVASASRVVVGDHLYGNIEYVASIIQRQTGADTFVIDAVQEYPADHDELIDFAVAEMDAGTLPVLTDYLTDVANYDTVFLGYPIWNAELPMPVRSFLDSSDLAGKTVYTFTVHGGSGFGGTMDQVREVEPNANVVQGFSVSRNDVGACEPDVLTWLAGLGVEGPSTDSAEGDTGEPVAGRPATVVYFSRQGHTRAMAQAIAERASADLFEIVPVTPYPDGMAGAASVAEGEHDENARPEIQPGFEGGLGDYEVIFLGYPIWYGTAPMVIGTWLDAHASELAGKVILPFCTSSYTTIDEASMDFVRAGAAGAEVRPGCTANYTAALDAWLVALGY